MVFPTIKMLARIHDADHALMRAIGKMTRAQILEHSAEASEHERACFNPPRTCDLRMIALDHAARTHGAEYAETIGGEFAEYLNTGDSYAYTLIRWRGAYRVQSIGDFIETMERQRIRFK